jgi:Inorganic pyrophosphatase
MGNWGSIVLTAIFSYFAVMYVLPEKMTLRSVEFTRIGVFGAILVGLVVGTLMSFITEYYTAMGKRPVMSIVRQSSTGHATNIIGGLSVGMESTLLPILVLAGGIYGSYLCAGLYGVAIAAAGMMATTAMQLAIDAFGPIADNAGGIAEMSELPGEVREKTDILDAVGNTTAATGKGFAIASAALTALALFAAFVGIAKIDGIDIYRADVLAGLFVGAMIPFIFSSLAITAVGQAAMAMVEEVRRQFREIPGILDGKGKPEYEKCVAISTKASIKKMLLPGAIAIVSPLIIGFILGPEVLGGFLAGATVSGVLMGIFQNNAGGAWDNAKKSFEKGVEINGEVYYKKSEPHKASVTGDTVGDPFKDTSGPSMNILIKLMSIVSLVIAPSLATIHAGKIQSNRMKSLKVSMANCVAAGCSQEECDALMSGASASGGAKKSCCKSGEQEHEMAEENGKTFRVITLPGSNKELQLEVGSLEEELHRFFTSSEFAGMSEEQLKSKWFDFDAVNFEVGSANLTEDSKKQLDNLIAILKAYPDMKIKIGGYTDKTGDEETNLKLSQARADAIKTYLNTPQVVSSEGYGSQFASVPVDALDAERAKDRRVSLRLVK